MFDLSNRVAVITGASSGLGVQMAEALSGQGAKVALLARREERLKDVAERIKKNGGDAIAVRCDVTSTEDTQKAVQTVLSKFSKVDILVTSAGVAKGGPSENCSDADWDQVVGVNLTGVFKSCREFGREMIKNKYGRIINIASMYGQVGNVIMPTVAYHATKGAVINMTRALGAEWIKHGVTVNAIGPGFFESEMTQSFANDPAFQRANAAYCPAGRLGRPGELNGALIYLASDEASYTTGTTLFVDGGWTAI